MAWKLRDLALTVLALTSLAQPTPGVARPFTAKDLATLDRVGDPQLSPDGRYLVYTVRATDWEANKGVISLWLLDNRAPGLGPRKLAVSAKGTSQPRWSADGRSVYFLSSRAAPRSGVRIRMGSMPRRSPACPWMSPPIA